MGLTYLWDTNSVIYYFNRHFPPAGEAFIDNILVNERPVVSLITEIELLCWRSASDNDLFILKQFLADALIIELNEAIKWKTIEIRKSFNLKLPDAVIAATASVTGCTLISRNIHEFGKVTELKIYDPFAEVK